MFKTGYDLSLKLFQTMQQFPKEYQYLRGQELTQVIMELMHAMYQAKEDPSLQTTYLQHAKTTLAMIKLRWRIYQDLQVITSKKYLELLPLFDALSQQLIEYLKHAQSG
jgi:hypothetical protein